MPPPPNPAMKGPSGLASQSCNGTTSKPCHLNEEDVRALADLLDGLCSRSSNGSSNNISGLCGFCAVEEEVENAEGHGFSPQTVRFLCFKSQKVPDILVVHYLTRLSAFFCCSPACYVVAAAYIDRVLQSQPDFVLDAHTVHRTLLASLVVAVKFTDDTPLKNSWYAKAGGVTNRELNLLESTLLEFLGWRVHVSAEEYDYYCGQIWPAFQRETKQSGQKRSREPSPCLSKQPLARRCRSHWPVATGGQKRLSRGPRRAHSAPVGYAC
mmetsp:Transcript_71937/g.142729  ORF Transcript_71937/g.142729 Transcript_71937/m.142729 type:complete len:268 (+) Transcript_71937:50-853(+)